jgi:hypothetical protein
MSDLVIVILVVIPVIVGTAVIFYSNTDMNNTFWQRRITELEAENARLGLILDKQFKLHIPADPSLEEDDYDDMGYCLALEAEITALKSEIVTLSKKVTDYEKELSASYAYDKTCQTCRYLDNNKQCVLGGRCVNYALWQGRIL